MCIYSYNFKQDIAANEQLISGFLSAIGSFAQEIFQTGLQTIEIRNGKKLVFSIEPDHKLVFCAIADTRDNNFLLEKTLSFISATFISTMKEILTSSKRVQVDYYLDFNKVLVELLKNKVKPRNSKTMAKGITIGFIILVVFAVFVNILTKSLQASYTETVVLMIFLFLLSTIFSISCFFTGYIAGNPKVGLRAGILFFVFLNILILIGDLNMFLSFLLISPFVFIACVAAGYFGGLICDRKNLYPID
jgi:hypothetical protein